MNVLSLFDGISIAQLALKELEIKVDNYFASEIDKYSIAVTKLNFPNTIQLGDIKQIKPENLPDIDLMVGGFPCPSFSRSGKQKGFEDERGRLFFDLLRIFREVKPRFFLFENVVMKKQYEEVINSEIGVTPILINSSLVSAQTRQRMYWTNIKGVTPPEDRRIFFPDIIDKSPALNFYYGEGAWGWINSHSDRTGKKLKELNTPDAKAPCLEATMHKKYSSQRFYGVTDDVGTRFVTPLECERLQTLPDFFTLKGVNPQGKEETTSNTQRYKQLGNSFTKEVIKHILNIMCYNVNTHKQEKKCQTILS